MKKFFMLCIAGLLMTSCCYVPSNTEGINTTPVNETVVIMPPTHAGPKDIKFTEFTHNNHKWYLVRIFYDVQTVVHSPDCPCNNKKN